MKAAIVLKQRQFVFTLTLYAVYLLSIRLLNWWYLKQLRFKIPDRLFQIALFLILLFLLFLPERRPERVPLAHLLALLNGVGQLVIRSLGQERHQKAGSRNVLHKNPSGSNLKKRAGKGDTLPVDT